MIPKLVPLLILMLAPAHAFAATRGEVEITLGGPAHLANYAFVSVTICEPGTDRCETIPDVQLDSGSTGLRLFASKVSIAAAPEKNAEGSAIGECKIFGGGESLWGSVAKFDVVLGDIKAASVPVQLIDAGFASVPGNCDSPIHFEQQWSHGNGILGIGPALSDVGGQPYLPSNRYQGARYYACGEAGCADQAVAVADEVVNPVALLAERNNGVLLQFPALPVTGNEEAYRAKMVLGIGNARVNQPGTAVKVFRSESMGWVPMALNGKIYWSKIDTGASYYSFPFGQSGLPHCAGDLENYLCPLAPSLIAVTVKSAGAETSEVVSFPLGNASEVLAGTTGRLLVPNVAYEYGGLTSGVMILGFPFFLGRDIFLGIDGQPSSLGAGPFYAF